MADSIGRIFGGGNSYGVGGYVPQRKNEGAENQENQAQVSANNSETQVDPQRVMDFLAQNNYFMPINVEAKPASEAGAVDAETEERIASYMERFEEIYAIIEQEFGPELAPAVMDFVMDKLIGSMA